MHKKILKLTLEHKVIAGILALVLIGGGYYSYQKLFGNKGVVSYALASAEKGTLVVSITGSGQTSVVNQVDIKPKASGDIVYVGVKNGQEVKAGTLLAQIDATDAQKAVRDAEINLTSAQLDLKSALAGNTNVKQDQETTVQKAYQKLLNSTFEAVPENSNQVTAYPNITGNYVLNKEGTIKLTMYDATGGRAFAVTGLTGGSALADPVTPKPIGDSGLYITFPAGSIWTDWTITIPNKNASDYLSNYNAYQLALTAQKRTNMESGVDTLSLEAKKLFLKQKENALLDAQEKLANYFIRAPFSGILAEMNAKKGNPVSGDIVIATLITKQRIAVISLNEVDVAKVKVGQKVTLTFDAVPELSITGEVTEIASIGAVAQGVVTYDVKIGFDTQDERVKPGMSVSAAIITDVKQNAVLVPNSALKQQGNTAYVEIVTGGPSNSASANVAGVTLASPPQRQPVEVGLSNDTMTEIVSGLKEGDQVVTRTIQSNSTQTQAQPSQGGLRIPGLPSGGGGFRGGGGGGVELGH